MTPDKKRPATDGSPSPVGNRVHNPTRQLIEAYQRGPRQLITFEDQLEASATVHQELIEAAALLDLWKAGDVDDVYVACQLGGISRNAERAVFAGHLESSRWREGRQAA